MIRRCRKMVARLERSRLVLLVLLLANVLLLPFASPFVVGTSDAAGRSPLLSSIANSQHRPNVNNDVAVYMTTSDDEGTTTKILNPTCHKSDESKWKRGEFNSTIPSKLLFSYASPLLDVAATRQLDVNDAFILPNHRKMGSVVSQLERIYDKCRIKRRRKVEQAKHDNNMEKIKMNQSMILLKSLFLAQRRTFFFTGILRLVNTAVQAFPALLVANLLRLIEKGDTLHPSKALGAVVKLVGVLLIKMITENQYFHNVVNYATLTRGSLSGLIFNKSLRLPAGGLSAGGDEAASSKKGDQNNTQQKKKKKKKKSLGAGEVLNLMQSDASQIEFTALQLHTIWDGPLQIAVYTSLLYRYLGRSVIWGVLVLLMTIPLNSVTLRILNKLNKYEIEAKDARTKRTTESIANMKLLKLQGWEGRFADDIRKHRNEELRRHVTRGLVRALNSAVSNAVPAITLVVTLTAYSRTGKPLVPSTIFTAISLFNQLRFPLFFFPMLIDSLANGKNALRRISSYLSSEELTPYVKNLPASDGKGSIEMMNGTFLWSSSERLRDGEATMSSTPALCDVNMKVNPGEVVAVIGSVGSGKTALVKSLLGELAPVPRMVVDQSSGVSNFDAKGNMDVPTVIAHGGIAYCSQEAWLPKGSIRSAVVFGREYDEDRYMKAIADAGLDADIVDSVGGSKASASNGGALSHDTDVGEGGSSLSGGQRARVALARSLYGSDKAKVFLLDDPLAALDASVGSTVFDRMTRRLRKDKAATVIVTNDPSLPRRCDRVILMGKHSASSPSCSTIIDVGTYDELVGRGHDISSLNILEDDSIEEEEDNVAVTDDEEEMHPIIIQQSAVSVAGRNTVRVVGGYEVPLNDTSRSCHADPDCVACVEEFPDYAAEQVVPVTPDIHEVENVVQVGVKSSQEQSIKENESFSSKKIESPPEKQVEKKLTSADDAMSTGAVPLSTYRTYLKSVRSPILIVAMLASYLLSNGAQFFQQYIIAKWTELGKGELAAALGLQYLRTLINAAGVVSVVLYVRSYLTMWFGTRASRFLHNRMLSSVFAAPMSFFDATPSGQLLSRFGKEMETIDRALPDGIGSVLFCFLQITLSGLALAGVITPAMFVPLSIISYLYYNTMSRFRPAARDLKRSESKTRSPIYTHFGEALRGSEIIRSIPTASSNWSSQHYNLTDQNLGVFSTVKALDRWLSIRLESLGNVVVFAAAVASVALTRVGRLKAGSAGWGLTQALSITGLLTWAVRVLTDLETNMMSVMRVKELTDLDSNEISRAPSDGKDTEKEATRMPREKSNAGDALADLYSNGTALNINVAPHNDTALTRSGWPWKGGIKFNSISMRYNSISPLVLDNVTISISPGTTLGVVGRTGSGKSSLLLTLFRLVEIEAGGSIEIDGVDIRSITLQTLRESLSIIPQDPVLFAGTIMYNLDATEKSSEEDAWEALAAASPDLATKLRKSGQGLNFQVSEGGKNLSVGERQLVCLARALLRKSKVLVLDEATSSVDVKTDASVQDTIRREFVNKGVTVLTVAHRLDTILGYDKIAVLGSGKLLEYGTPNDLLRKRDGELRRLVDTDRRNKRKGAGSKVLVKAGSSSNATQTVLV